MAASAKRVMGLVAEGSPAVGTGHVVETFSIARAALRRGLHVALWVNRDCPPALLDHAPVEVKSINDLSPNELERAARKMQQQECSVVLTNFRRLDNAQVAALRSRVAKVACIDELGNTDLDCNLIINNSIVSDYHYYTSGNPDVRIAAGPQYMAMSEGYEALNRRARSIPDRLSNLLVTLGGTDQTGTTFKIVDALLGEYEGTTKRVVVGAAFSRRRELESMIEGRSAFELHYNVPSLGDLIFDADVGFTYGGNTLYEFACVGTPPLVLFEAPHERDQARAFERNGFGHCLGSGPDLTADAILAGLKAMEAPEKRRSHSEKGRSLVDGRGAERIVNLMCDLSGD